MRTLAEIRRDLAAKVEEVKGIDQSNADALKKGHEELKALNDEYAQAYQVELAEQRAADNKLDRLQRVEGRNFSLVKFINEVASGKGLTGLEKEVADMGADEYKRLGLSQQGVVLPSAFLRASAGQNYTTAADGGNIVETSPIRYVEALKERLVVKQLGATVLGDLVGTVPYVSSSQFTAQWGAEGAEAETQKIAFEKMLLTPHRNFVAGAVSKDLLRQTSADVEALLTNKILDAHAALIDRAAIAGTGANSQPTGILKTAGIATVSGGTNGAAITYKNIVALESAINANNANRGKLAYLTNAKVWGALKTTETLANSGRAILDPMSKMVNGYPADWSNLVPSDLTKGTGTALSAVIFGNWEDLVVAQWGGLDLVIDPFTSARKAEVNIVFNAWNDVKVVEPKSFAAIVDVVVA